MSPSLTGVYPYSVGISISGVHFLIMTALWYILSSFFGFISFEAGIGAINYRPRSFILSLQMLMFELPCSWLMQYADCHCLAVSAGCFFLVSRKN